MTEQQHLRIYDKWGFKIYIQPEPPIIDRYDQAPPKINKVWWKLW